MISDNKWVLLHKETSPSPARCGTNTILEDLGEEDYIKRFAVPPFNARGLQR